MGVPEAAIARRQFRRRGRGGAVGVALFVGVGVMLAMVGDPGNHRSLHGHRAEYGEDVLERFMGLKGAVGEKPVKPDRDPDRGQ